MSDTDPKRLTDYFLVAEAGRARCERVLVTGRHAPDCRACALIREAQRRGLPVRHVPSL